MGAEGRARARRDRTASTRIRVACPGRADRQCRPALPRRPARSAAASLREEARDFNERLVFQAWDMLAGRLLPELGGSRAHLDIVGINYYWTNQWEWRIEPLPDGRIPPLADDDPRRVAAARSGPRRLAALWRRHADHARRPMSATSAAPWLREVAAESESLAARGRAAARRLPLSDPRHAGMARAGCLDADGAVGSGLPPRRPGDRLICEPMLDALQSVRHIDELHHMLMNHPEKLRFLWPRPDRWADVNFAEDRQRGVRSVRRSRS